MTDPTDLDVRLDALASWHARVDAAAARVAAPHEGRLQCRRGCSACCIDGLRVGPLEAALIRREAADLLAAGRPGPEGACAMLDEEGGCRIYAVRPFVCRTQGLPLAWFEEDEDEFLVERRDICPENRAVGPLEDLPVAAVWQLGPAELELERRARDLPDAEVRTPLRELFDAGGAEALSEDR